MIESPIWRPVIGFEGKYEVSNTGQIRSMPRIDARGIAKKGKVLKPSIRSKYGHLGITLYVNPQEKTVKHVWVHRVVAEAFLGAGLPSAPHVRHADGSPSNNAVTNLVWGTRQSNRDDRKQHGTHGWKLSDGCVSRIRDLIRNLNSDLAIADWFHVHPTTIRSIRLGYSWA